MRMLSCEKKEVKSRVSDTEQALSFNGHAKLALVYISLGYVWLFIELHDEDMLTWIECFYIAIPALQLFQTHIVAASNSA